MNKLFTMSFWLQLFFSTLMTMVMIYLIKRVTTTVNVPIIKDIANAV